jgi:hypothetical protein
MKGEKRMAQWPENGYWRTALTVSGKQRFFYVHRLVGLAFLGSPPRGYPQINHKNGDKQDNRPANLEWSNASENGKHAYAMGLATPLRGEERHNARLTPVDVLHIRALQAEGVREVEILRAYPTMSRGAICSVLQRRTWRHLG